jgi:hypothetical protein
MHKLFPSQSPDEKIYIAVREHWILLALRIAIWSIFVILLIAFFLIGPQALPLLFEGTGALFTKLVIEMYLLFLALSLLIIFVLYYLNLHIITNIRIVDIDQVGLFRHMVSELHIEKIEDVTSDTNGILGNIFDYGTVRIQTAGTTERFEFQNVPHPARLTKIILDLYTINTEHEKPEAAKPATPTP